MNRTPKKEPDSSQDMTHVETSQPKIMTMPLPEILEELENYIRRVEEAVKHAQAAAKESRQAAAEAKESGEKAAEAAKKAAEAAVAKFKQEADKALDTLGTRVSAIEVELNTFKERVNQEALAVDRAFLTLKERHIEESPFLDK
ncbi:hypothetical protein ACFLYL_02370 [Chloroflexota bacterium]